jgi:hypothetical protein
VVAQDDSDHRAIVVLTLAFAPVKRAFRAGGGPQAHFARLHRATRGPREQRLSILCARVRWAVLMEAIPVSALVSSPNNCCLQNAKFDLSGAICQDRRDGTALSRAVRPLSPTHRDAARSCTTHM